MGKATRTPVEFEPYNPSLSSQWTKKEDCAANEMALRKSTINWSSSQSMLGPELAQICHATHAGPARSSKAASSFADCNLHCGDCN